MTTETVVEDIWRGFQSRLRAYFVARSASPQEAEDLLQEVFLRIHTHLGSLDDSLSLSAWIHRIAANALTDHHRARTRETRALEGFAREPTRASESSEASSSGELARCLEPLLAHIPESYGQAVALSELEGLSQKEVSERLGLSVSGAKSRVQRGRRKLKAVLLDCCDVELDRRRRVVGYSRREGCNTCEC